MEKTERFTMRVDESFLRDIDEWRRRQPDIPPRSEAIRRLVFLGMIASRRALNPAPLADMLLELPNDEGLAAETREALRHAAERWLRELNLINHLQGRPMDDRFPRPRVEDLSEIE
jgi:hypothetical protein